jgi:xanthine dehydrogenase accessory factor
MKKIFREMADLLLNGESFVVATVFDQSGSAPRRSGAKMLLREDGKIRGTIGGGRLEADAIQVARQVLLSKQPVIWPFELTGKDASSMDMICGGHGQVLLEFIDGKDEINRIIYEEAMVILETKGKGWLITSLCDGQEPDAQQYLIKRDGAVVGRFEGDIKLLSKLILVSSSGPACTSIHSEELGNRKYLVEPLRNSGTVYIFGAGHVSQNIAPLSEMVGFKTVVLDDRSEYANSERFPASSEITLLESFDRLPELAIDEDGYIVIVTRGHLHDKTILAQALKTKAGYIGMIGSRRKREKIFEMLAGDGFGKQDFDRVYSPIGTDIGAETPEELAVSIVGELIKVRAEKEKCVQKKI